MWVFFWTFFIGLVYFFIGLLSVHWHRKYILYLKGHSYYQLKPLGKTLLFLLFPRACIRMKNDSKVGNVFSSSMLINDDNETPIAVLCLLFWPIHWFFCKPVYIIGTIMVVFTDFWLKYSIVQSILTQIQRAYDWCADRPMEWFVKSTLKQHPSSIETNIQKDGCDSRRSLEVTRIRISTELEKLAEEQRRVEEQYAELLAKQEIEVQAAAGQYRG